MAARAPKIPELPVATIDPLESWLGLQHELPKLSEEKLWELLEREKRGQCRHSFVQRLFGRANKLRAQREAGDLNRLVMIKAANA